MTHQLAELNIARLVAPLDSPALADFVAGLAEINALADASPGFVWRLQTPEGDATSLRPYADERLIVNLSVWETLEQLKDFAYKSHHTHFLRRRAEWFEKFDGPYMALWWVKAGEIPTVWEAKERLEYLRAHAESPYAFSFRKTFAPDSVARPSERGVPAPQGRATALTAANGAADAGRYATQVVTPRNLPPDRRVF